MEKSKPSIAGPSGRVALVICAAGLMSTLAGVARAQSNPCARPVSGPEAVSPAAGDALFVIRASVGLETCEPCVCDIDGDGLMTATDALLALAAAVGIGVSLDCPSCEAVCGDQVVTDPEQCDDGNQVNRDDCTNECMLPVCGDGIVHSKGSGTEQCDDANSVDADDCTNACLDATCGDGILRTAGSVIEECDDGNASERDACINTCELARCGDGAIHDQGGGTEQCDDANIDNDDECTNTCMQQAACVDISGRWNSSGGGRVCCSIDGQSQGCDPAFGQGALDLEQFGCTAVLEISALGFDFSLEGPVTRNRVMLSTEILPESSRIRCTQNILTAEGPINASVNRIDYAVGGGIDCDVDGGRVVCSIAGSDRWTR